MAKRIKAPAAACLACAAALVLLALLAYRVGPAGQLDVTLLLRLSAHEGAASTLAEVLARLADPLPLIVLLALAGAVALRRGRPADALAAVVVVAGANLAAQALKVLFAHPRYQPLLGWDQISTNAFPSGHATAAASLAIAFAFAVPRRMRRRALGLGAGYALAVGCSAVVLDWHYPSDVLAGYLVAAGWGFAVLAAMRARAPASAPAPWPPQSSSRPAISTK